MTDNTRQEAVERATAKLSTADPTIIWDGLAAAALDASGLITQLTEAIAQRDNAANVNTYYAQEAFKAREQLAAERALCDRLAEALHEADFSNLSEMVADFALLLDDYDARRTTERANTETAETS